MVVVVVVVVQLSLEVVAVEERSLVVQEESITN
jgi:hypothetical protein